MKGRTHLIGGAIAGLCVVNTMDANSIVAIGIAMAGSLLPDIDIETSTISTVLKPLHKAISVVLSPFKCGVHRGITHSLVFTTMLSLPLYMINHLYGMALFAGLLSHMILDLISGGVCILSPFINKRLILGKIKTGSFMESMANLTLLAVLIGVIVRLS